MIWTISRIDVNSKILSDVFRMTFFLQQSITISLRKKYTRGLIKKRKTAQNFNRNGKIENNQAKMHVHK